MSSRLGLALLLALPIAASAHGSHAGLAQEPPTPQLDAAFDRVVAIQRQLTDLHPAFAHVYPIAVARDKMLYVYEQDAATHRYRLVKTAPDTMNLPAGLRAAMPLDFWGNRIACVVTPDAFDALRGFVLVFHEFVHCYQWETCELRLKEKMGVYRSAMARKDYMWELQYDFPYTSDAFSAPYGAMLTSLVRNDVAALPAVRRRLKQSLSPDGWDYMTWQEWKEGLARYLENLAGARLGLPANTGGANPPFSRVTFYAGGEALIRALSVRDPGIDKEVERLYHAIAER